MATNVSEMEKAYSEAIEWLIAQALDEESQFRHGGELEYLDHFARSAHTVTRQTTSNTYSTP